ncbi:hypothetical protein [Planctomonas psychrotolerans]|uniref:hypothetical protein n=1 Tax=Planctomonas psychrotolerans TaxID=2528712 RepID=UPI001D0D5732|nr:hypothetical protein [Planctomonas psychrotolerans]
MPARPTRAVRAVHGVLAILLLQLVGMLTLRNSPFQDEALYMYVGHRYLDRLLDGDALPEAFSSYLSGLPYFYPVIGGVLDRAGGIEFARVLSTVAVLATTYAAYRLGSALFTERVGLLASATVAAQTSFLLIGRLATYDACALAFFAAAAVVAVETRRHVVRRTVAVVLLCVCAVAAKYALASVVPAAGLLLLLAPGLRHDARTLVRIATTAAITSGVVITGGIMLLGADSSMLAGVAQTTTARVVSQETSTMSIVATIVERSGAVIVLALVGLALLARKGGSALLASGGLLLVASVVPAYHLLQGELTSLDKHLALSGFLLAPLAGLALVRVLDRRSAPAGWVVVATVLILMFSTAVSDAQRLFRAWPDSAQLHVSMLSLVRDGSTEVLAEEVEVLKYYLVDQVAQPEQFTGLDFFDYVGSDGQRRIGAEAYARAIEEGHFDVIAFRYGPSAELARSLTDDIERSGLYEQVAEHAFTVTSGDGNYIIWRRSADRSEEQQ